jgi:3-deoxy-manno-octulosonate cytidylyltransferase (CMP-KDO synthetase)
MPTNGILCIIPARYASTRLPGKPLCMIKGLPLIMWAYNNALAAKVFDTVCVATDDLRILEAVERFGGVSLMTSGSHVSGTDRVAEAATKFESRYVVNLQGDEPCTPPDLLAMFAANLDKLDDNSLLTCVSNATIKDKENPNVVKVVCAANREAIYFSRAPIPYDRDGRGQKGILVHGGIYGFTANSLKRFCSFPVGALEMREKLEQLRALENGMRIVCLTTDYTFGGGIDTPEDLAAFKKRVEGPA